MNKKRMMMFVMIGTVLLGYLSISIGAQKLSPHAQILALLTDSNFGLAELRGAILAVERKLTPPGGTFKLSSGLFGLPAGAAVVDWMVVNDAATTQTFTVTVFKAGVGPKTVVTPGTLTITLASGASTHNSNGVGFSQPFVPGFYYEVVVETSSPNLLPSVHVWQDSANTVIPGTLIPPGSWVRLE